MDYDVVFVGGGLASTLAAGALLARRPERRVLVLEREARLGGNHTWCFHGGDLPSAAKAWLEPLVVQRWPGYSVRFPGRKRRVAAPYARISSDRLHEVASGWFERSTDSKVLYRAEVQRLERQRVELSDGRTFTAKLVVDARGPAHESSPVGARGYQKFVGLELMVAPENPIAEPILFDACLPQRDGFTFMYVLPLAPDRYLVEETFFSDGPELDESSSHERILAYAEQAGFHPGEVVRSERGVLPMPYEDPGFDLSARPLRAGYGGGLFHPVTGYSFPMAVRFALALADSDVERLEQSPLAAFAERQRAQRPFFHLLTRLLFTCFAPEQRYGVLEHFYRLPEALIERFYAGELGTLDRARIFVGSPPPGFSLHEAVARRLASWQPKAQGQPGALGLAGLRASLSRSRS